MAFTPRRLMRGASAAREKDPYFNYVTMLLHGDGTNGAQNNTFVDGSTNNFSITRVGNTTQGSFSPYGSNWSNFFDGSSTYFTLGTNPAYNFSTGSWTYECWVNLSGGSTSSYYTLFSNGWPIQVYVRNNAFELYVGDSNTSSGQIINAQTTSANSVPVSSWVHFALVRNSSNNTYKMYVNGVEQASTTSATNPVASTANFAIGAFGPNLSSPTVIRFVGYVSNFRATASAVYTSNFTPSTTPLTAISGTGLLTCQSNRFVDNSTTAATITVNNTPSVQRFNPFGASTAYSTSVIGGSGYFDGTGDYLNFTAGTTFNIGTGNFTIEFWANKTANGSANYDGVFEADSGGAYGWFVELSSTRGFILVVNGVGSFACSTAVINDSAWHHWAICRSGSTWYMWRDGVALTPTTNTISNGSLPGSGTARIGFAGTAYPFNGYMSDLRVVNGTALYTTAFTPPTAPLTAISGTLLLTKFQNAAIFDNAMMNDLETVGNAQISTSVYKYGTGSMYFDGTGDYLVSTSTNNPLAFGSGDFTIEFWLYLNSTGTQVIFDGRNSSASDVAPMIYYLSGLKYYTAGNDRITGGTLSTGQWYYITLVKASGSTKLYINGNQTGSTYTDGNNYVQQVNRPLIGAEGVTLGNSALNGYIDDVRITKGYARYTANTTPPTKTFSDTGPN